MRTRWMMRYLVAFVAICVGVLVGTADLAVTLPALPAQQRGAKLPERDRLIFDACIAMYGTAYPTARLLYRWLGAHTEAAELHKWSRWHQLLLHAVGGCWLLAAGWGALEQGLVRPSLFVGLFLIILTASDGRRKWRGWQGKVDDN